MVTKEQKIDILSRYCADKIGHGMREKVYDVIKHVVDFLESDRASEVGVQPKAMPNEVETIRFADNEKQ